MLWDVEPDDEYVGKLVHFYYANQPRSGFYGVTLAKVVGNAGVYAYIGVWDDNDDGAMQGYLTFLQLWNREGKPTFSDHEDWSEKRLHSDALLMTSTVHESYEDVDMVKKVIGTVSIPLIQTSAQKLAWDPGPQFIMNAQGTSPRIYTKYVRKLVTRDSYAEGELGDTLTTISDIYSLGVESMSELVLKLNAQLGFPEDIGEWGVLRDGVIGSSNTEDDEGQRVRVTDPLWQEFVAGDTDLWSAEYEVRLEFKLMGGATHEPTVEEITELLGLQDFSALTPGSLSLRKLSWDVEEAPYHHMKKHKNGDTVYFDAGGNYHRTDGPAYESVDGDEEWFEHGRQHRRGGPAVIYKDTREEFWYENDKLHRLDGPAVTSINPFAGEDDEPTIIQEWWINGREVAESEFEARARQYRREHGEHASALVLKQDIPLHVTAALGIGSVRDVEAEYEVTTIDAGDTTWVLTYPEWGLGSCTVKSSKGVVLDIPWGVKDMLFEKRAWDTGIRDQGGPGASSPKYELDAVVDVKRDWWYNGRKTRGRIDGRRWDTFLHTWMYAIEYDADDVEHVAEHRIKGLADTTAALKLAWDTEPETVPWPEFATKVENGDVWKLRNDKYKFDFFIYVRFLMGRLVSPFYQVRYRGCSSTKSIEDLQEVIDRGTVIQSVVGSDQCTVLEYVDNWGVS